MGPAPDHSNPASGGNPHDHVPAFLALASCLARPPAPAASETAADVVTLRDGKTVAGEMDRALARPGSVGLYVRRSGPGEHVPDWADRWEKQGSPAGKACRRRRARLEAWHRDRAGRPGSKRRPDHDLIDRELLRIKDDEGQARARRS